MSVVIGSGSAKYIITMEGCASISIEVGYVIAFLVLLRGDAVSHMLVGGMPLDPCNFD